MSTRPRLLWLHSIYNPPTSYHHVRPLPTQENQTSTTTIKSNTSSRCGVISPFAHIQFWIFFWAKRSESLSNQPPGSGFPRSTPVGSTFIIQFWIFFSSCSVPTCPGFTWFFPFRFAAPSSFGTTTSCKSQISSSDPIGSAICRLPRSTLLEFAIPGLGHSPDTYLSHSEPFCHRPKCSCHCSTSLVSLTNVFPYARSRCNFGIFTWFLIWAIPRSSVILINVYVIVMYL